MRRRRRRASQPRFLPLALDLFYLLFAYSETSYIEEQEAMSVALRIFHANPIVRSEPGAAAPWELTLTMEHRSYDELSRLWQATTRRLRMSLVYRAAVVFIDPDTMPRAAPADHGVLGDGRSRPGAIPVTRPARLPGRRRHLPRRLLYLGPAGAMVPFSQSPATVAAGQTVWLLGSDLGRTGVSDHVYLLPPAGGAEVDVTAWAKVADSSAARFVLTFRPPPGRRPAGAPEPGVYQLRVGSGAPGSPGSRRSGSTPVSVAARVNPPEASPPRPGADRRAPIHRDRNGLRPGRHRGARRHGGADRDHRRRPGQVRSASTRPARSFTFAPPRRAGRDGRCRYGSG